MVIDGIEYVSTEEAAMRLGTKSSRVRQLISRGQLAYLKIGNTNLVPVSAIEERLANSPKAGWPKGRPRTDA